MKHFVEPQALSESSGLRLAPAVQKGSLNRLCAGIACKPAGRWARWAGLGKSLGLRPEIPEKAQLKKALARDGRNLKKAGPSLTQRVGNIPR